MPEPLPVPALESLRQVFHGPDSPSNIVMLDYGDLGLLPDRPSQAKLQELRNAVQKWLTTGPGAPARALSVEDAPFRLSRASLYAAIPITSVNPHRAGSLLC